MICIINHSALAVSQIINTSSDGREVRLALLWLLRTGRSIHCVFRAPGTDSLPRPWEPGVIITPGCGGFSFWRLLLKAVISESLRGTQVFPF